MTDEQLAEIERRNAERTPGPWRTNWKGQEFRVVPDDDRRTDYPVAEWTFAIMPGDSEEMAECDTRDADFIAHAPEDVTALLALVNELAPYKAAWRELQHAANYPLAARMDAILTKHQGEQK